MIHFKRNNRNIYSDTRSPSVSSESAGHALIQRILFNRRRGNAKIEPFAVLGSRQPHYIHIRTSGAYVHYLDAEQDSSSKHCTRIQRPTAINITPTDDSASVYSCESGEAHVGDELISNIDFTVIWDPETGFSVYGSDPVLRQSEPVIKTNKQMQSEDVHKKPLPRLPSGILLECAGLSSQFPGETDSESFYGASEDSGHPDCEPHLPSRFSMTTTSSFIQSNDWTTTSSGKKREISLKLRQQLQTNKSLTSFPTLQVLKCHDKAKHPPAYFRHFPSHFSKIKRKGRDISDEPWVFVEVYPRISGCLL